MSAVSTLRNGVASLKRFARHAARRSIARCATPGSASYAVNAVNNGPQSASGNFTVNSGTVATTNGGTAASSSATLVVLSPPTVVKRFAPTAVSVGSTSVLKITGTALAGVAFTDTYPAGLVNTATPAGVITGAGCSGTVTAAANGTSLASSAGSVSAGGSCDITVNVSSASAATGSQRHRVDRMDPDRRAAAQCLGAGHVHGSSRALRPTRQQRRHNHGDCGCTMPPTSPADLNPRSPSRGKVECWDRSIARVTAAGAHGAIGAAV